MFHVDEDMKNYIEIHDWMIGLTAPTEHVEYTSYVAHTLKNRSREDVFSDAHLQILTSHKNVGRAYKFFDAFPTSLSPLEFDTTDSEIQYLDATLTLRYVTYELS